MLASWRKNKHSYISNIVVFSVRFELHTVAQTHAHALSNRECAPLPPMRVKTKQKKRLRQKSRIPLSERALWPILLFCTSYWFGAAVQNVPHSHAIQMNHQQVCTVCGYWLANGRGGEITR